MATPIENLRGGLIVSCQPVRGGPMDRVEITTAYAQTAQKAGARALRIESEADVRATRKVTNLPIIGLIKRDEPGTSVYITPLPKDIAALVAAGADIIAFDATDRPRPMAIREAIDLIHSHERLAMADISNYAEGVNAIKAGADIVASTLSGYTGDTTPPTTADLELVASLASDDIMCVAEGRLNTPDAAAAAIRAGAYAVTVGSAITRPEHIINWYLKAIATAG